MNTRVTLSIVLGVCSGLVATASCVGDTPIASTDSGSDGSSDVFISGSGSDASDASDATNDAGNADTGPSVDGSYAFSGNWPTFSLNGVGAESVAALPSGGFVIGGSYTGNSASLGPYALPAALGGAAGDAYVALFDSAGKVTAAIGFGGTGNDNVTAVAADAVGDIYIAGFTNNGLTLNGYAFPAGTFIAKLDSKNLMAPPKWTRGFEATFLCAGCMVSRGTVLEMGVTFGWPAAIVHYDTGKSVTSNGGLDILLLTLDPSNGNVKWAGQIGGTGDETIDGVDTDGTGASYLVAHYTSATFVAGQALGNKVPTGPGAQNNLLVAKIDAAYTPVYAYAYGDPGGTQISGAGIAADGTGRVAVGGTFGGGVDFGMGLTGASADDGIVFVIDEAQGKTVWQQVIGDTGYDGVNGIAFDAWGHLLAGGQYQNTPQIGTTKLPGASYGAFVAKFSPKYASEWATGFVNLSDGGDVSFGHIAVASSGTSAVCGGFGGTADFGNGPVSSQVSARDTFLAGRNP